MMGRLTIDVSYMYSKIIDGMTDLGTATAEKTLLGQYLEQASP